MLNEFQLQIAKPVKCLLMPVNDYDLTWHMTYTLKIQQIPMKSYDFNDNFTFNDIFKKALNSYALNIWVLYLVKFLQIPMRSLKF